MKHVFSALIATICVSLSLGRDSGLGSEQPESQTDPKLGAFQHVIFNDKVEWIAKETEASYAWRNATDQFISQGRSRGLVFDTLSGLDRDEKRRRTLDGNRLIFVHSTWNSREAKTLLVPTNELRATVTFSNAKGETVFVATASRKNRKWQVALQSALEDCYSSFLKAYPGFDPSTNPLEKRKANAQKVSREAVIKEMDSALATLDLIEGVWATTGPTGNVGAFEVGIRKTFASDFADYLGILTQSEDPNQLVGYHRLALTRTASPVVFKGHLIEPNMASRNIDLVQVDVNLLRLFINEPGAAKPLALDLLRVHPKLDRPNAPALPEVAERPSGGTLSTGTCFLIDPTKGLFATNWHVVADAKSVRILLESHNEEFECSIEAKDVSNDLVILKARGFERSVLNGTRLPYRLASKPRISEGQKVFTVGHPLAGILGVKPRVTDGTISSRFGPGDDPRYLQVSVPIQPGNSGGPLVTERGELVGIVTASLRKPEGGEAVPQNVNFAIKASYLLAILESLGVTPSESVSDHETKAGPAETMRVVGLVAAQ